MGVTCEEGGDKLSTEVSRLYACTTMSYEVFHFILLTSVLLQNVVLDENVVQDEKAQPPSPLSAETEDKNALVPCEPEQVENVKVCLLGYARSCCVGE